MWFVSKKKYDAMVAEKDRWYGIAEEAIDLNSRLVKKLDAATKEMKSIQELNHRMVKLNGELVAHCKELEKQRDMWRERAEEENRQAEIYRGMLKCAEVG